MKKSFSFNSANDPHQILTNKTSFQNFFSQKISTDQITKQVFSTNEWLGEKLQIALSTTAAYKAVAILSCATENYVSTFLIYIYGLEVPRNNI